MNIIEKTVEPKNGAIDLHVDVPAEWNGKQIKLRIILEEDTDGLVDKDTKPDLTRFRGKWAHLPLEERLEMQRQLDEMRNEWDRPIF